MFKRIKEKRSNGCIIEEIEKHYNYTISSYDSLRWYTDSPYSTIMMINGEDISYIYDVVNGDDKIYRIYDLYNGKTNERNSNDIFLFI